MRHSVKEWFIATRYWSFPVSAMPVIVTTLYLLWTNSGINWANAIMALVGILIFHTAGNILSDYNDFKKGVDTTEAFATPNLVLKKFEPEEYLRFGAILFIIGCLLGAIIAFRTGWWLLAIGGAGALLTVSYSYLKYNALGDLTIFLNFGVLPILGTSYAETGRFYYDALVLAIPIGIITVAVLHANNTLDIPFDRKAGIKTFAMKLGVKTSAILYMAYMIIPFIAIIVSVFVRWLPWQVLLCTVACFQAVKNIIAASHYKEKGNEAMVGLDQSTAKVQLVFSLMLAIGLAVATLLS